MAEYCTWADVFSSKKGENEMFIILYWYLFNKPDCQVGILKTMDKLQRLRHFKNLPESLISKDSRRQGINKYIQHMEEYNLIGRIDYNSRKLLGIEDTSKRRIYFQALQFFYFDPFCVKTPRSRGKDVLSHFKEYEEYTKNSRVSKAFESVLFWTRMDWFWTFKGLKHCLVNEIQRVVQVYAPKPETFMSRIFPGKRDYLLLYELILKSFLDVEKLRNIENETEEEGVSVESEQEHFNSRLNEVNLEMLDKDKVLKDSFYHKYFEDNCFPRDQEIEVGLEFVTKQIERYRMLQREHVSFNRKTLMFE